MVAHFSQLGNYNETHYMLIQQQIMCFLTLIPIQILNGG